jgi:hypothetical protein
VHDDGPDDEHDERNPYDQVDESVMAQVKYRPGIAHLGGVGAEVGQQHGWRQGQQGTDRDDGGEDLSAAFRVSLDRRVERGVPGGYDRCYAVDDARRIGQAVRKAGDLAQRRMIALDQQLGYQDRVGVGLDAEA